MAASPGEALTLLKMNFEIDVRSVLPTIQVPTSTWAPDGRSAGERRWRPLHGRANPRREVRRAPWQGPIPPGQRHRRDLSTRSKSSLPAATPDAEPDRVLATVLFTDIVGSTERAAELGDRRWRELLVEHHDRRAAAARPLSRPRVDTAGDGFLADLRRSGTCDALRLRDLEWVRPRARVRAGLHTGECEMHRRRRWAGSQYTRRTGRRTGRAGRGARFQHGQGPRRRLRDFVSRIEERKSSRASRTSGGCSASSPDLTEAPGLRAGVRAILGPFTVDEVNGTMSEVEHVVVIGGGVAGAATAYY